MIREIGRVALFSAILLTPGHINHGELAVPKSPESRTATIPEQLILPGPEVTDRKRSKRGHLPLGIDPGELNRIAFLYPETR